ncbi:MAG: ClpXP protease specificity-enhancing factor SspB [Pseudomonadota bacterium]|nr:ClpXP protease specificity-enhancing factor SspB [Pseudomonadota bacterium]
MNEIDYEKLTHKAMLNLISDILSFVSEEGLPGEHHFYISFKTQAPKVSISDSLIAQYPDEMTIVLQNQFENLIVTPEGFSLRLSFNHTPHDLYIPFDALTKFYDPSVSFGLVLEDMTVSAASALASDDNRENGHEDIEKQENLKNQESEINPTGEVVSLENFRDKND